MRTGPGTSARSAPYFELHGTWTLDGQTTTGPVTTAVLEALGVQPSQVTWRIRLANLKAYQFTLNDGDRIECEETIAGDTTTKIALFATSPRGDRQFQLIPGGERIPVGAVQLANPNQAFPELRLRFYPPAGLVYGPSNLLERILNDPQPGEWQAFDLPGRLFLNADAAWPKFELGQPVGPPFIPNDPRKTPQGIHAFFGRLDGDNVSLGLVDDVTDGIIECTVADRTAFARIAVGPPDFAPDRRHIVSLQDGLADRVDRAAIRALDDMEELDDLVRDLFERALETSDAMNKDAELDRLHSVTQSNETRLRRATGDRDQPAIATIWPTRDEYAPADHRADALPVSFAGRRKHRRYVALEYLTDRLREDSQLLDKWIRRRRDGYQQFDRRMPPLMRGSHGGPMNLTQRQNDMLQRWVEGLRQRGMIQ